MADSGNRPALYARIGLVRANARAAVMNLRARLIDSIYRMIDLGVFVVAEIVDQVAELDIDRVADRYEMREADLPLDRPVEHRGTQRARLRDEGDIARLGHAGGETDIQLERRHDDARDSSAR